MNIYYKFYCRAYDWYNTNKKKSDDTLRVSAIALLSILPLFNILTIFAYIGLVQRSTYLNRWVILSLSIVILIFNFKLISSSKSAILRREYLLFDNHERKKVNIFFKSYLIISVIIFIIGIIMIAYYKNKYGNYDL